VSKVHGKHLFDAQNLHSELCASNTRPEYGEDYDLEKDTGGNGAKVPFLSSGGTNKPRYNTNPLQERKLQRPVVLFLWQAIGFESWLSSRFGTLSPMSNWKQTEIVVVYAQN